MNPKLKSKLLDRGPAGGLLFEAGLEVTELIKVLEIENRKLKKHSALVTNQLVGPSIFRAKADGPMLRELAVKEALFEFDDHHHAPACAANNWHKQLLPTGRCTCGTAHAAAKQESAIWTGTCRRSQISPSPRLQKVGDNLDFVALNNGIAAQLRIIILALPAPASPAQSWP